MYACPFPFAFFPLRFSFQISNRILFYSFPTQFQNEDKTPENGLTQRQKNNSMYCWKNNLAKDTPVPLGVEGSWVVGLPQVIEGSEEDNIGTKCGLDRLDGGLLVRLGRNSSTVGGSLGRPSGFYIENSLVFIHQIGLKTGLSLPVTMTYFPPHAALTCFLISATKPPAFSATTLLSKKGWVLHAT